MERSFHQGTQMILFSIHPAWGAFTCSCFRCCLGQLSIQKPGRDRLVANKCISAWICWLRSENWIEGADRGINMCLQLIESWYVVGSGKMAGLCPAWMEETRSQIGLQVVYWSPACLYTSVHINRTSADISCTVYKPYPLIVALNKPFCLLLCCFIFVLSEVFLWTAHIRKKRWFWDFCTISNPSVMMTYRDGINAEWIQCALTRTCAVLHQYKLISGC